MKSVSHPLTLLYAAMVAVAGSLLLTRESQAQVPGNITIFGDQGATECSLVDSPGGTLTLYVFHTGFSGMLSSDFRVQESSGFHASYVSESIDVPIHDGDFRSGIFLGYGECLGGSILLGTVTYATHGQSEDCSYLDVVEGQIYPWPATESCFFEDSPAPSLGKLYVNPNSSCHPWCVVVATEETTWGKVKALYR